MNSGKFTPDRAPPFCIITANSAFLVSLHAENEVVGLLGGPRGWKGVVIRGMG